MRVITLFTLRELWTEKAVYADALEPTLAWYRHVLQADWRSPAVVKREFGSASILRYGRVVFNVAGNKYRFVVWINWRIRDAGVSPAQPTDRNASAPDSLGVRPGLV